MTSIAVAWAIAAIAFTATREASIDPALFTKFRWRHIGPVGSGEPAAGPLALAAGPDSRWHGATDAAFPYRVCGVRAGSGALCIASRSDRGRITIRDWAPVGRADASFVALDPVDADVLYFSAGSKVTRLDRRTGQEQDVSPPRIAAFRASARAPLAFSPVDPKTLFYGAQSLWKTSTAGQTWTAVSPDLSQHENAGAAPGPAGTITAVAPSFVDSRAIWAGTDTGRIQVTRDGGATWSNVTPPALTAASVVSRIEPSHFDPSGAYAAVHGARPGLYRTRDGGASWTDIGRLPATAAVHTVREDPFRRGLLFAGADAGVFVSFDDGDGWQQLRLNMPGTAVHDLVVKDGDLVAITADRGFWILDDISPLRQLTRDVARADVYLFRPGLAWRFRGGAADRSGVEPSPPNPPDGVVISYLLNPAESGTTPAAITLEIIDTASGDTLRRLSSDDAASGLSAAPGLHRVVWDVRYAPPPAPASASLQGMFALPGTYQVRLTVGARVLRQAVVVRLDPRVKTSQADLLLQFKVSKSVHDMLEQVAAARTSASARGDAASVTRLEAVVPPLVAAFESLQHADARPTDAAQAAATAAVERAAKEIGARAPL